MDEMLSGLTIKCFNQKIKKKIKNKGIDEARSAKSQLKPDYGHTGAHYTALLTSDCFNF